MAMGVALAVTTRAALRVIPGVTLAVMPVVASGVTVGATAVGIAAGQWRVWRGLLMFLYHESAVVTCMSTGEES